MCGRCFGFYFWNKHKQRQKVTNKKQQKHYQQTRKKNYLAHSEKNQFDVLVEHVARFVV